MRRLVAGIALAQLGVGVATGLAWGLGAGWEAGAAALSGGLIALLSGLYFAVKVFAVPPDASPERMLRAFYLGEAFKLIITAALFMIALQWLGGVFLPLITSYIAALAVHWFALLGALHT